MRINCGNGRSIHFLSESTIDLESDHIETRIEVEPHIEGVLLPRVNNKSTDISLYMALYCYQTANTRLHMHTSSYFFLDNLI